MDELLVKYLLEEATDAERVQVQQWMDQKTEHRRYFEHFRLIWMQSKQVAARSTVDEAEAWKRFRNRTNAREAGPSVRPLYPQRWLSIAAMLAVVAGAAWAVYFYGSRPASVEQQLVQSGSQTRTDTLPDGSVVTLNRHSSLAFPEEFTGDSRRVALTGEAFFQVQPDRSKPFLIDVDGLVVRVVGTSFNVKSTAKETEVIVETGLVEVAKDNRFIKVSPREKVVVRANRGELTKQRNTDEFYRFYRTNELVCEKTPLWKLVGLFNEAYDARIVIANENLTNLPISTTFRYNSLDRNLEILRETFAIKVERKDGLILLK